MSLVCETASLFIHIGGWHCILYNKEATRVFICFTVSVYGAWKLQRRIL